MAVRPKAHAVPAGKAVEFAVESQGLAPAVRDARNVFVRTGSGSSIIGLSSGDRMNTFSTRRFFSAPPAAVFATIQDGERLARWWGPAGFANRFAVFEFRPQGRWIFTMVGRMDGSIPTNRCSRAWCLTAWW